MEMKKEKEKRGYICFKKNKFEGKNRKVVTERRRPAAQTTIRVSGSGRCRSGLILHRESLTEFQVSLTDKLPARASSLPSCRATINNQSYDLLSVLIPQSDHFVIFSVSVKRHCDRPFQAVRPALTDSPSAQPERLTSCHFTFHSQKNVQKWLPSLP